VEEHFCPIKTTAACNGRRKNANEVSVMTSKGRSLLGIAMSGLKVDILRYLVVEKNVSVFEIKDLKVSLRALETVLLALPAQGESVLPNCREIAVPRWDDGNYDDDDFDDYSSLGEDNSTSCFQGGTSNADRSQQGNTSEDICIICYDNPIDCVITPCGHQICCLECSSNMDSCPVCNADGQFIRIFRP
jgi:hypothetical protein